MEIAEKENEEKEEEKKKEVKEKKEEKQQTNSVSLEPQKQIRPEPSEEQKLQRVQDLEVIEGPTAAHRRVRRPRVVGSSSLSRPEPSEEELLEFEEDLREFIALRASCKPLQPNAVQTFRRPRTARELQRVASLRAIKCHIEVYEMIVGQQSVSETSSRASSVSVKSDSSMYEPPSFNPERKQSQLTEEISSCSVCEEAVKDPVRLLCGHRSCKQCVLSFRNQSGATADYSCKKCGRRPESDQDLQSVLLEKKIKRVEMEMEKLQAEKEKSQPEKEMLQAEKEKFQAEKEKFQAEKEKFQAEKEKFQAEKEKIELEKRKLALEIQLLEQRGSYTNYDQGVVIPKTRIPYI